MIKRINNLLESLPITIVGGVFLAISFVLSSVGIDLIIDPACITIIICGLPLLYLGKRRLINLFCQQSYTKRFKQFYKKHQKLNIYLIDKKMQIQ